MPCLILKVTLSQVHELERKVFHARSKFFDGAAVQIVENRRGDGCRKPERGGEQRFRSPRRAGAEAGCSSNGESWERVDNAPLRAEQPDKRRYGSGGGE